MMKVKLSSAKGITLIALVITIVILLILAAISINLVLGDNGIISKADRAKDMQEVAQENDKNAIASLADQIEDITKGKVVIPKEWDEKKVTAVRSSDNIIVPVPKGYSASKIKGENSVATGFVIKQGTDGNATTGINEFVWVPVSNASKMYGIDANGNYLGKLYEFSETTSTPLNWVEEEGIMRWVSATGYREPDIITGSGNGYDAESRNLQNAGLPEGATAEDLRLQLQNEFKEMIESVKKYGGFYIGRYETGSIENNNTVVQKNSNPAYSGSWYYAYNECKQLSANDDVITNMIWGCQWDATLTWMQTSSNSEVANFATNSLKNGNYHDNQVEYGEEKIMSQPYCEIPAGSSEETKVNNIYDMAGNAIDWTMEAYSTEDRVTRGGSCYNDGNWAPVSKHYGLGSTQSTDTPITCRATLYISNSR